MKTYISVQTFDREVLHQTARVLSAIRSVHVYQSRAGWLFCVENDDDVVLLMTRAVYGYMINGEHTALPSIATLTCEGRIPPFLDGLTNFNVNYNTPIYYKQEEE